MTWECMGNHHCQQVTDRARILNRILVTGNATLNKPHAFGEKGADGNTREATPQGTMVLAGLKYSVDGIRISCNEEIPEALRKALTEFKVTNMEGAQHVIGTIQYSYTAFKWEKGPPARLPALMKILNGAMKVAIAKAPKAHINWSGECKNVS